MEENKERERKSTSRADSWTRYLKRKIEVSTGSRFLEKKNGPYDCPSCVSVPDWRTEQKSKDLLHTTNETRLRSHPVKQCEIPLAEQKEGGDDGKDLRRV